jgi:hypothetical protein
MFLGGSSGGRGRGGGSSGQAAPSRGHGLRGGFGNMEDYHNRRAGSFTDGGGGHQSMGNSSLRGGARLLLPSPRPRPHAFAFITYVVLL